MPKAGIKKFGLLIDQCLSPELAKMAMSRGITSVYVGHMKKLYGKTDQQIARYALRNEMTLVTNNMVDFQKIYQKKELHPGLIFITWVDDDFMNLETQMIMFEVALHNIDRDELIQEALEIQMEEDDGDLFWVSKRYPLPL